MKYKDVIKAINEGKNVYCSNENYKIIKDNLNRYLIHSQANNHYVMFGNNKEYLKKCFIIED